MKMAIAVLTATAVILIGSAAARAQAPSGYEAEPVLNATDLATPELLKGPHFTVDPKVPVRGFIERFTIRSAYGTFQANGLRMLPIRVNEVEALAKSLGVDPYTTNVVLSEKLTSAAWVAFSGRFLIQTATSILVPYSMAMSAVTITNSTVYDTPPADIINNDTMIFGSTGATEAQVQALVQNPQYSLTTLTELALGIHRLQGVPGRDAVVIFAAAARTQDECRFVAGAINMLARYREAVAPIAQVSAPGPVLGRTTGGALVLPAPVDYVAWLERVGVAANRRTSRRPRRSSSSRAG